MRLVLSPEEIARFYGLTKRVRCLRKSMQTMDIRRLPSVYTDDIGRHVIDDRNRSVEAIRERLAEIEGEALGWCMAHDYVPGLFLASTILPRLCLVPFLALPPQVTHPEVHRKPLKVSTYINMGFVPVRLRNGKVHKNVFVKTFYPLARTVIVMHRRRLFSKVPKLEMLWNKNVSQYGENARGRENAIHDIVRVFVGSAWLVWMYHAYNQGVVRTVILPYHLAQNPELHLPYMIDPIELVTGKTMVDASLIRDATWRWLVETAQRK